MIRSSLDAPELQRSRRGVAVWIGLLTMLLTLLSACGGEDAEASPWAGSSASTTQPLIVALCHGANQSWPEAFDQSYYEFLFSETEGSTTIADYWRDVSHGEFSIAGTRVLDVQLDIPRDDIADRDDDNWEKCRTGINEQYDIDWGVYDGPIVFTPQTRGRTVSAIDADDTEVQVRVEDYSVIDDWPTAPFTLVLTKNGSLWRNSATDVENVPQGKGWHRDSRLPVAAWSTGISGD